MIVELGSLYRVSCNIYFTFMDDHFEFSGLRGISNLAFEVSKDEKQEVVGLLTWASAQQFSGHMTTHLYIHW